MTSIVIFDWLHNFDLRVKDNAHEICQFFDNCATHGTVENISDLSL